MLAKGAFIWGYRNYIHTLALEAFPRNKIQAYGAIVIRVKADVICLVEFGLRSADREQVLGSFTVSQLEAFRACSPLEDEVNTSRRGE